MIYNCVCRHFTWIIRENEVKVSCWGW